MLATSKIVCNESILMYDKYLTKIEKEKLHINSITLFYYLETLKRSKFIVRKIF